MRLGSFGSRCIFLHPHKSSISVKFFLLSFPLLLVFLVLYSKLAISQFIEVNINLALRFKGVTSCGSYVFLRHPFVHSFVPPFIQFNLYILCLSIFDVEMCICQKCTSTKFILHSFPSFPWFTRTLFIHFVPNVICFALICSFHSPHQAKSSLFLSASFSSVHKLFLLFFSCSLISLTGTRISWWWDFITK